MNKKTNTNYSNNTDLLKISYGMRFSPHTNWVAYLIVIVFIFAFATAPDSDAWIIMVPLLLLILLVMITATNGVKINREENKYQYYFSVFGITVGKWQKWAGFTCLVLKSSRKKRERGMSRELVSLDSHTQRFNTTEIYMMDSSHRRKLFCGSFEKLSDAKTKAKEISDQFNFPIQKFSPKRVERRR